MPADATGFSGVEGSRVEYDPTKEIPWREVAEAWRRRWLAVTEKFNLNAKANKKLRAEIATLRKEIHELQRLTR